MSPSAQPRFAWLIQVGSLAVTGTLIWMNSIAPRLHRYSWATLIGSALGYTLFACGASALITGSLLLAIPCPDRRDILRGTLRTSAAGAWFAPAIILLSQFSPTSLAAAMVLVITTTRLLYSEWRRLHPPEEPLPVWIPTDPMFGEADPPRPPMLQELAPSLAIAVALQATVTAFAMRAQLLGGALFALTAAMITISLIDRGLAGSRRPQNLPRSVLGLVLTILLASGLTVGGLRGRVVRNGAGGTGPFASGSTPNDPSASPGSQPPGAPAPVPSPLAAAASADGSYPGVILQPEISKTTRLIAPVSAESWFHAGSTQEFAIPFEGEYWMYRFLYRRPPPNSFLRKGTPAELSFHTPDHWPLMMDAHQKLDQPLDLRCCRSIEVRLWNADAYPGTVSLELIAIESDGPVTRSQSFGKIGVRSVPDLKQEHVTAVPETLEFILPQNPDPAMCHELEVIFRRDNTRADKSARIAIDRFILVPR